MKKSLLFSSFILCSFIGFGQCPTSPITLSTQAEVDAFASIYPGCTELLSDLIVTGNDITNLDGLARIETVTGLLWLAKNPILWDISGLQNISFSSGGNFSISRNDLLTSIDGILSATPNVTSVYIASNPILESLVGLEGITTLDIIDLRNNDVLVDLSGLENLNSVEYSINILQHENLVDFGGFQQIQITSGYKIGINSNPSLVSMNNFLAPGAKVASLSITYNHSLINLNGLESITELLGGTLRIGHNNSLEDLSALGNITADGFLTALYIEENPQLNNLIGLEGLNNIQHQLNIVDNDALTSLNGLDLLSMGEAGEIGIIYIGENEVLNDISALADTNLAPTPWITISDNPNLAICHIESVCNYLENNGPISFSGNASGCNSVSEVEAGCGFPVCPTDEVILSSQQEIDDFPITYNGCSQINGNLSISGLDITDLSPLSGLTFVEQDLFIGGTSLTDLSGLAGLTEIGGLVITNNPLLTHLTGLENIETMCYGMGDNDINILNNTNLISIASLMNVSNSCLVSLNISNNPSLLTLEGLNNIDPFEFLTISYNDALVDLQGLEGVNNLEDDLNIQNNNALTSLVGLQNLASVWQIITILNNDSLLAIDFPNILGMSHLTIEGNPNLTSISGFTHTSDPSVIIRNNPLLTSAGIAPFGDGFYRFEITNNDSLTDLSFMAGLDTIEGFVIRDNDGLTSFNGLEATAFYTGIDVIIDNNSQLVDISAMAWTDLSDIAMLRIKNNDLLSLCSEPSICTYLMGGGASEIKNNNGGCNTAQEIMAACLLSNGDLILEENISLYPNPVSSTLQIQTSEGITLQKATVFSILGEELISTSEETIDFSTLSAGIYFVEVLTDLGSVTKKIVKE